MKESAFRLSVLSKLPASIHRQPMLAGMMGTAGTPDTYLDGPERDLWVEWKILPKEDHIPKRVPEKSMPTAIQRDWLDRRFARGGNALVIIGVKLCGRAHGVVLDTPQLWSSPPDRAWFEAHVRPAASIALYLTQRTS